MLRITLPRGDAGPRLLGRIIEHPAHLLSVQTSGAAAGCRAAEISDDAVRIVHRERAFQGHGCPYSNVVAEHHGAQEMHPADSEFLSDRQRCRNDRAAWMRSSYMEVVVGLI